MNGVRVLEDGDVTESSAGTFGHRNDRTSYHIFDCEPELTGTLSRSSTFRWRSRDYLVCEVFDDELWAVQDPARTRCPRPRRQDHSNERWTQ